MSPRQRWLRFNAVGVAGFGVQIAIVAVLAHVGVPAAIAVAAAVFGAVSHNFLWHEHVTWRARSRAGRARRWLSFNLSNGLVSLVSNVVLTTLLVGATGAPLVAANIVAVVTSSLLNFYIADRLVFHDRCS
jgi:putative flippase GtrA